MAKQIYIDSNGNEVEISGTINYANMLPLSVSDSTDVNTAISDNTDNIGSLSQLTTTDKSSLVGAVNEVNGGIVKTVLLTGSINSSYQDNNTIGYRNLQADRVNITSLTGYPTGKTILGYSVEYCHAQSNTSLIGIIQIYSDVININSKTNEIFDFGIKCFYK